MISLLLPLLLQDITTLPAPVPLTPTQKPIPVVAPPVRVPVQPVEVFKFGVVGDSQNQPQIFTKICESLKQEGIELFVGLGDHEQNEGQYPVTWHAPRQPINTIPVFGCIGNHDPVQDYVNNIWSIPLHAVVSIYGPAVACYGATTVGGIRFVCLDTNEHPSIQLSLEPGGDQRMWLLRELASTDWASARWRVVVWHHPVDTEQWDGGCYYPRLSGRIWAHGIVAAAGAALVLNGHAHAYQRGLWLGVPWIISGGGGGYLDRYCADLPEITVSMSEYHYLIVVATQDEMEVIVKSPDGSQVLDNLHIRWKP